MIRWIFAVLSVLVLLSTLYESYNLLFGTKTDIKSALIDFYESFSVIKNFKTIFDQNRGNEKFVIFDGIRTILSFWVLYNHIAILDYMMINSKQTQKSMIRQLHNNYYFFLFKILIIIDTFFCIGGIITTKYNQ